jgi:hypothetical protein
VRVVPFYGWCWRGKTQTARGQQRLTLGTDSTDIHNDRMVQLITCQCCPTRCCCYDGARRELERKCVDNADEKTRERWNVSWIEMLDQLERLLESSGEGSAPSVLRVDLVRDKQSSTPKRNGMVANENIRCYRRAFMLTLFTLFY